MERKLYISKLVSHHCSHGSLNPAGSHFYNYIDTRMSETKSSLYYYIRVTFYDLDSRKQRISQC